MICLMHEGEPYGLPGTYLNGVYELRPLPYAEAGFGYPESGQSVINVVLFTIAVIAVIWRLMLDPAGVTDFDVRMFTLNEWQEALNGAWQMISGAYAAGGMMSDLFE